jgi:hypothetical protein
MSLFYEIEDDLNIDNRWMLGNLNLPEDYAWNDIESQSLINTVDWTIEILLPGSPLDVTIVDFGLIMANKRFINLLPVEEVEYKTIKILNYKGNDTFYLVAVKNIIDCIDKDKSKYKLWKENNNIRPDLAGQYEYFTELKLKTEKIAGYSIFIVKGYESTRVVSEEVKNKFQEYNLKGITFRSVT